MPALHGTGTFAMPASIATRLTALAIGDDDRSEQALTSAVRLLIGRYFWLSFCSSNRLRMFRSSGGKSVGGLYSVLNRSAMPINIARRNNELSEGGRSTGPPVPDGYSRG